jgi:hypothetical protein
MADEGRSLPEQCSASIHDVETLLSPMQEQKIKHAMTSQYIAPGAVEGRTSQISELNQWTDIDQFGWNKSHQNKCALIVILTHSPARLVGYGTIVRLVCNQTNQMISLLVSWIVVHQQQ